MPSSSIGEMCDLSNSSLHSLYLNVTASDTELDDITFTTFQANHAAACEQHSFEQFVSRIVPVVFAVIVVLGVIGNGLVLIVVLFGQQMRNTTNILILVSYNLFIICCSIIKLVPFMPFISMGIDHAHL
jgi:hypothetical protein